MHDFLFALHQPSHPSYNAADTSVLLFVVTATSMSKTRADMWFHDCAARTPAKCITSHVAGGSHLQPLHLISSRGNTCHDALLIQLHLSPVSRIADRHGPRATLDEHVRVFRLARLLCFVCKTLDLCHEARALTRSSCCVQNSA